ncbi:MAG: nitroreductase family protein [Candidatus Dormiibacterota bacterium]
MPDLEAVMRKSGAVRAFTAEPVGDAEIWAVLDAARFAPSGGNRQGWAVIIIKNPALRRKIKEHYVLGWREYMAHVHAGLVPFAPGPTGSWHEPAVDLAIARSIPQSNQFADNLESVPVMLVIAVNLTKLAVTDNGLGRQSIVGGASIYPFVQNIILAANARGLGGVVTTVLTRDEEPLRPLLHLPEPWAIAALVALGRPARPIRHLSRKGVSEFTTIDRLDGPVLEERELGHR